MRLHREAVSPFRGSGAKLYWSVLTALSLGGATLAASEPPIAPSIPIPAVMPSKPVDPGGVTGSNPTIPVPMPMPSAPATPTPSAPTLEPTPPPTHDPMTPSIPAAPAAVDPSPAPSYTPAPTPYVGPVAQPRVYVINGVDPFGWAGLRGMTDQLRAGGYDARFGGWYQSRQFEREIRQNPGAPVAIIGYSFGTYRAKAMANRLTRDGIPVSMVGYVGGDYLRNTDSDTPGGARVVNVTGNGFLLTGRNLFFNGTDLSGANNLRLGVRHFDLPKQQQTVDALLAGLSGTPGGSYSADGSYATPTTVASAPEAYYPPGVSASPAAAASAPLHAPAASAPYVMAQPQQAQPQQSQPSNRPVFRLTGRSQR